MSVIAAIMQGGRAWIGSDQAVEAGSYRYREPFTKWRQCAPSNFTRARRWVGVTGSMGLLELLGGCDASSGEAMRSAVMTAFEESLVA